MVEYTINAVNNLLVDLRNDTYDFLGSAFNNFLEEKISIPYSRDYLRMIRERAEDINLLSQDVAQFPGEEVKERLHRVLDDIIMVQGPVDSFIHVREHHEKTERLEPNGILDLLRKYSKALEDYTESIKKLIE